MFFTERKKERKKKEKKRKERKQGETRREAKQKTGTMSRSAAMRIARREAEERELQREYAQLKMEHASLQRRKEELETKNQNMREEIVALDEQLDRKTGNLFSKLQQIKNNDALKKKLQESLKKRSMDNVDDLDDLIHHARAVSKNAARKAPDSIDGAITQDLASIAGLIKRLEKHVNISSVDVVDGGVGALQTKEDQRTSIRIPGF